MASENAKRDSNHTPVILGYSGSEVKMLRCDSLGHLSAVVTTSVGSNTPEHHNGTVGASSWATVSLSGTSVNLNIHNTHGSNNLLISFDSGVTYYTLECGSYWNIEMNITSFQLKGSGASTTYECVAVISA